MRNASAKPQEGSEEVFSTFRLPEKLRDDFRRVSRAQQRAYSQQLRLVMQEHVDKVDAEAEAEPLEPAA